MLSCEFWEIYTYVVEDLQMAASEYSLLAEIKLRTTVTEICNTMKQYNICDVLRDLVTFAQL